MVNTAAMREMGGQEKRSMTDQVDMEMAQHHERQVVTERQS